MLCTNQSLRLSRKKRQGRARHQYPMLGRHQHISDRCLFAQSTLRNVYGAHLWAASQLCCVKRLSPNPADWLISIIAGQDVITNLKVFDQLRPGQGRHNTVRTETRNDISTLAKRPEAATELKSSAVVQAIPVPQPRKPRQELGSKGSPVST